MNKHHDGLYSKMCQHNLSALNDSCLQVFTMVNNHFKSDSNFDLGAKATYSTKVFDQYNFFTYPLQGMHDLFHSIKDFFYECQIAEFGRPLDKKYYIQSWVNVYNYGEYIDWHGHGDNAPYAWHGFFCVNAEPSKTTYQFLKTTNIIDVESKNNLLVLGRSNTDTHRTWPWTDQNAPRITIAFDIVPDTTILRLRKNKPLTDIVSENPYFKNHWIPI